MKRVTSILLCAVIFLFSAVLPNESKAHSSSSTVSEYTSRLPDSAVCIVGEGADSYGVDLSAFDDDGYVLEVNGDQVILLAKTDVGLDLATRYFEKNSHLEKYRKVHGEGYKVGDILIGGVSISEFAVVYPTSTPYGVFEESYEFAAHDLAKYIKMATGIEVPVFPDRAEGYSHRVTLVCDTEAGLGNDGFEISVRDGCMTVTGTVRGVMYGVYEFLEQTVGYRFLSYGQTYLYEAESVSLDEGYVLREIPRFIQRSIYSGDEGNHPYTESGAEYSVKRHAITEGSVRPKYGGGGINEANHGYWVYIPSVPGNTQPCLTDDNILEECIENIENKLLAVKETYPGFENEVNRCVRLGHNDNNSFCKCSECMRIWGIEGGFSGLNVRFCNAVADSLNETFDEEIIVEMFAYWGAPEPPKKTFPNEHVSVTYCSYQTCWNHPLGDSWCDPEHIGYDNLTNKVHADNLKRWCEITDKVIVYWYGTGHQSAFSPISMWDTLYEDFQVMYDAGADGIMSYANHRNPFLGDLVDYLTMKLAWEPNMSREKFNSIRDEFMMLYFGDSWDVISHLADIYSKSKLYTECLRLQVRTYTNYEYAAAHYDEIMSCIDYALSLAGSDTETARIKRFSSVLLFEALAGTYEDKYVNETSENKREEYVSRYRDMHEWFGDEAGVDLSDHPFDPDLSPFELSDFFGLL